MDEPSSNRWLTTRDETRAETYDAAWDELAATGADVHGEATLVEGLGPQRVLDAGCGTGRVAIELARRGIATVGVDLDPTMLAVARRKAPHLDWIEGDLATVDLAQLFDVVVAAGNVMIFLAPGTEGAVVANLAGHLRPGGLLVAGFQLREEGLSLAEFDRLCTGAGLVPVKRFATWDRDRYDGGDYAVSIAERPQARSSPAPPTSAVSPGGA